MNSPAAPTEPLNSLPWQVKAILAAGGFGGVFPCLVRVAVVFTQGGDLPVSLTLTYWIGALLLAGLGGGVAWIFNEDNIRKAFFLGLSLPSFLQLQLSENIKSIAAKNLSQAAWFISSAIAQEPPRALVGASVPGRLVTLRTVGTSPLDVTFTDGSGKDLSTFSVTATTVTPLRVPDNATHITFGKFDATSASIPLPRDTASPLTFEVKVKQDATYGFFQALGAKPDLKTSLEVIQTSGIASTPSPPPPAGG